MKTAIILCTIICVLVICFTFASPSSAVMPGIQVDTQPRLAQEIPQAPWMALTPAQVASVAWNDRF